MYLVTQVTSTYQTLTVYETNQLYGRTGKYRVLQFSKHAVQGAMDLKDPERIVLEYPRALIHLMEANQPDFKDVFMIGHGIGTISSHYPDKRFHIAEIDEHVVTLSRTYFGYKQDNVEIGDGLAVLSGEDSDRFDYIVLDAFTEKGTPRHLSTLSFFQLTREKLRGQGAVILNLMGKGSRDRFVSAIHTTLREVYACTKAFELPGGIVSDVRNLLIIGSDNPIEYDRLSMAGFIEVELEAGYVVI